MPSPWNPYPIDGPVISVLSFGAIPDNKTVNTRAFQAAVDHAAVHAGIHGRAFVSVPAGGWLTGSFNLSSGVYLVLEKGGVLQASAAHKDYSWDWDYWHLVQCLGCVNTGVIGPEDAGLGGGGEIRGPMWQMIESFDNVTGTFKQHQWTGVRGCEGECRPKNLAFIDCVNVTVAGVKITESSDWSQLFRRCTNVLEERTVVTGDLRWGNNDGLDVESCTNVTIRHGEIRTADDCVAIRSGSCNKLRTPWPRLPGGGVQPVKNVLISNMTFESTSAAIKIAQLGYGDHGSISGIATRHIKVERSNRGICLMQREASAALEVSRLSFRLLLALSSL